MEKDYKEKSCYSFSAEKMLRCCAELNKIRMIKKQKVEKGGVHCLVCDKIIPKGLSVFKMHPGRITCSTIGGIIGHDDKIYLCANCVNETLDGIIKTIKKEREIFHQQFIKEIIGMRLKK